MMEKNAIELHFKMKGKGKRRRRKIGQERERLWIDEDHWPFNRQLEKREAYRGTGRKRIEEIERKETKEESSKSNEKYNKRRERDRERGR